MTLRTRLFVLVSVLVAAAVGTTTWTVSIGARRSFEAADRRRTAAQMAQIRREFERQGEDVALRLERIVASDGFQRTALDIGRHAGDYGAYVGEAASLAAAHSLDILDLAAEDGTLISSAEWPARFGYRQPWVMAATPSAPFLQPIDLPRETALALVAVRRVTTAPRVLYVAGGRRLDRAFLQSLVLPEGMRAWLYRNLDPDGSRQRLVGVDGPFPQSALFEPLIARVLQTGRPGVETIQWPDGSELVDASPLAGSNGAVLGVLLLGSSGRDREALLSRIRWSGVAIGAGGILAGLVLSYALARRVTQPVERLAGAARQIAGGNWDVRVGDVAATGELAALARAFDAMTGQIADTRDRLVQVERVAAWRELARRLAHELKNPLFPLRLTIDNLRRARALPDSEFREVLDESLTTMDAGLANLNVVVGRFSDFARMPAPEFGVVKPNDVVERAVALFRVQMTRDGEPSIALTLDLDPESASIRADGEQLGRVVQNLLLNAIDAMPRGGSLGIRTRREPPMFHLAISDTGEGLTAEECTRLFTPYYTTKQHGTGLGLAIVQSVVADHHGKVWVDSAPGRGSTFHIALPEEQPVA